MADTHCASLKLKWWVRPYIKLVTALGAVWCTIKRPSSEEVEQWIANRSAVVERYGVLVTVEKLP